MSHHVIDDEAARSSEDALRAFMEQVTARLKERGISTGPKGYCTACQDLKPVADFYTDKTRACGHKSRCKWCMLQAARKGYMRRKQGTYLRARRGRLSANERAQPDSRAAVEVGIEK